MKLVIDLIRGDLKRIARDPMLTFYVLAPLLLFAALRLGVPFVSGLLREKLQYDLSAYDELIMSVALLMPSLMLGCMSGFMMLDERDENVIQYYAVTPLSKRGYLSYRLSFAVALATGYGLLILLGGGLVSPRFGSVEPLLVLLAMPTPVFALFLVSFAANKVEGLAVSKGISLFMLAPAVAYFVPSPWHYICGVVPAFWIAKTYLVGQTGGFAACALAASAGAIVHLALLRYLYKRFMERPD